MVAKKLAKWNVPPAAIPFILTIYGMEEKGFEPSEFCKLHGLNFEVFDLYVQYLTDDVRKFLKDAGALDVNDFYSSTGSGDSNWIVLTPSYVANVMAKILKINSNSVVLDNCCGAGALLNACGEAELIGYELDLQMFNLCKSQMILRGKNAKITKGDGLTLEGLDVKPTHAIVNPPYNFEDNGMPFILKALDVLEKGGRGVVLIQSSAGTGKAKTTNTELLKRHSLIASVKMPRDLFNPHASVQTDLYFFEAHKPHGFEKEVRFVDFSDDGMKRTKRGRKVYDETRYEKLVEVLDGVY